MLNSKEIAIKYAPLFSLICIGYVTFYTYDINVFADMGEYMIYALNIFTQKGYTDINGNLVLIRGPVFPLMLAISYWLQGVSPWSALWVVRFFCILNPIIIYMIGKRMFGKLVGYTAALLMLTSYSINYWSYSHIDAVWPFFSLLYILALYNFFETLQVRYSVVAGIMLGIAYLTKQIALLLFPLPLLLFFCVKVYRNYISLKGALFCIFTAIAIAFPWIFYVFQHTHNIKFAILGFGMNSTAVRTAEPVISVMLKHFFSGLYEYVAGGSMSILGNFILAPLLIIGCLFVVWRAICGHKESVFIAIALILFIPCMSYVGLNNYRLGQLLIVYFLLYLAAAVFLVEGLNLLFKTTLLSEKSKIGYKRLITFLVLCGLILVQFYGSYKHDRGALEFAKKSYLYQMITGGKKDREFTGAINNTTLEVTQWIQNNFSEDVPILFFWPTDSRSVYFLTQGVYRCRNIPVIELSIKNLNLKKTNLQDVRSLDEHLFPSDFRSPKSDHDILFLSSQTGGIHPRNKFLWVLYDSDLVKTIKEYEKPVIVVGKIFNFMYRYFDNNPAFKQLASFGDGEYRIYKTVGNIEQSSHKFFVSERTINWLDKLRRNRPEAYLYVKDKILAEHLKLPFNFADVLVDQANEKSFTIVPLSF